MSTNEENTPDNPDFGNVDWSKMESLANGGDPEPDFSGVQIISSDMLAKRLMWDIAPCNLAVEASQVLGLPPTSEEVEDMEHTESHQRLLGAAPLLFFVEEMSRHSANAVVSAMIVGSGEPVSAEVREETTEKLEPVIFQSTFAIIAELLDVGVMHLAHFAATRTDDTSEDEDKPE